MKFFCILFWNLLPEGKKFSRELIFANFFFGHFARINFRELGFNKDFTGINFRELSLAKDFAGINFRDLSLAKDFAGINFRDCALYKDFAGVNFAFSLRNIFSTTLVYGFRTLSVKINTFLLKKMIK